MNLNLIVGTLDLQISVQLNLNFLQCFQIISQIIKNFKLTLSIFILIQYSSTIDSMLLPIYQYCYTFHLLIHLHMMIRNTFIFKMTNHYILFLNSHFSKGLSCIIILLDYFSYFYQVVSESAYSLLGKFILISLFKVFLAFRILT